MTTTRTRFAPSPTGFLHMGNARTALFAYLFARSTSGRFILRIEDTDKERLVEGSEEAILRDLKWLGLEWDEGPDVGGPLGPYRCSERYHLYEEQLKRLKKVARVYRCFCSKEQLDQDRKLLTSQKKIIKYVGRCLNISEEESEKRSKSEPFVWRLHVELDGNPITVHDSIRDTVTFQKEVLGDFIIFRSTGIPVFLFANAIDDSLQEMTHVIRGEDHLSNTFRQVLIYNLLGYQVPEFAHLPMIGAQGGGKFSKREGSFSISDLRKEGYLPQGLVNYLALLGWSPGDTGKTGEKFSPEELKKIFDLKRVNKARALFDFQKLKFLNYEHLKDLSLDEVLKLAPAREKEFESVWKDAVELVRHDASTLSELYHVETYLKTPTYDAEAVQGVLKKEEAQNALELGLKKVKEKVESLELEEALKLSIKETGKELELKGKSLFFPFRVAITGSDKGPELIPLAKILGEEETLKRLEEALKFGKSLLKEAG